MPAMPVKRFRTGPGALKYVDFIEKEGLHSIIPYYSLRMKIQIHPTFGRFIMENDILPQGGRWTIWK